jgi:hypothetical protein
MPNTYYTIDKTVEIPHVQKKGSLLNTLELFHIYLILQKQQINDAFIYMNNPFLIYKLYIYNLLSFFLVMSEFALSRCLE